MMQSTVLRSKWILLLLAMLVYGGLSWLNGSEPIGNAGAWLMVALAIGWPAALSSRGCASHLWKHHHS